MGEKILPHIPDLNIGGVPNLFARIGLERRSVVTNSEVAKKFRVLASRLHPDKNPGNKDALLRFQLISEAFGELQTEEKRASYEKKLVKAEKKESEKKTRRRSTSSSGKFKRRQKHNPRSQERGRSRYQPRGRRDRSWSSSGSYYSSERSLSNSSERFYQSRGKGGKRRYSTRSMSRDSSGSSADYRERQSRFGSARKFKGRKGGPSYHPRDMSATRHSSGKGKPGNGPPPTADQDNEYCPAPPPPPPPPPPPQHRTNNPAAPPTDADFTFDEDEEYTPTAPTSNFAPYQPPIGGGKKGEKGGEKGMAGMKGGEKGMAGMKGGEKGMKGGDHSLKGAGKMQKGIKGGDKRQKGGEKGYKGQKGAKGPDEELPSYEEAVTVPRRGPMPRMAVTPKGAPPPPPGRMPIQPRPVIPTKGFHPLHQTAPPPRPQALRTHATGHAQAVPQQSVFGSRALPPKPVNIHAHAAEQPAPPVPMVRQAVPAAPAVRTAPPLIPQQTPLRADTNPPPPTKTLLSQQQQQHDAAVDLKRKRTLSEDGDVEIVSMKQQKVDSGRTQHNEERQEEEHKEVKKAMLQQQMRDRSEQKRHQQQQQQQQHQHHQHQQQQQQHQQQQHQQQRWQQRVPVPQSTMHQSWQNPQLLQLQELFMQSSDQGLLAQQLQQQMLQQRQQQQQAFQQNTDRQAQMNVMRTLLSGGKPVCDVTQCTTFPQQEQTDTARTQAALLELLAKK